MCIELNKENGIKFNEYFILKDESNFPNNYQTALYAEYLIDAVTDHLAFEYFQSFRSEYTHNDMYNFKRKYLIEKHKKIGNGIDVSWYLRPMHELDAEVLLSDTNSSLSLNEIRPFWEQIFIDADYIRVIINLSTYGVIEPEDSIKKLIMNSWRESVDVLSNDWDMIPRLISGLRLLEINKQLELKNNNYEQKS